MKQHYYAPGYFPGFTSRAGHWNWLDEHHVDLIDGSGGGTYANTNMLFFKGSIVGIEDTLEIDGHITIASDVDYMDTAGTATTVTNIKPTAVSTNVDFHMANIVTLEGSDAGIQHNFIHTDGGFFLNDSDENYTVIIYSNNLAIDLASDAAYTGKQITVCGSSQGAVRDKDSGYYLASATTGNGNSWWVTAYWNSASEVWLPMKWGGSVAANIV